MNRVMGINFGTVWVNPMVVFEYWVIGFGVILGWFPFCAEIDGVEEGLRGDNSEYGEGGGGANNGVGAEGSELSTGSIYGERRSTSYACSAQADDGF